MVTGFPLRSCLKKIASMKLVYGIVQLILAFSVLLWPLVLFVSPFMFDSPGADSNPIALCLALSILFYPIPVIKGGIKFWKNIKEKSLSCLGKYTIISLIGPASIIFFIWLLEFACQGEFACK